MNSLPNRRGSSQDSQMNVLQAHINSAISSAINDRVLPEVQNIMGNLPLDQKWEF